MLKSVTHLNNKVENSYSQEIQDIMTAAPSNILRFGITVLFFLLILLIFSTTFIRYTDTVKASLKIMSSHESKFVKTSSAGRVKKVLVREKEKVKRGQRLAFLESRADHEVVLNMLKYLNSLQINLEENRQSINDAIDPKIDYTQLGELQISYLKFYRKFLLYNQSIETGIHKTRKGLKKLEVNDVERALVQQNAKARVIDELNNLILQTNAWKDTYILTAPQDGEINFVDSLYTDRVLYAHQTIFYIKPSNERFFGIMVLAEDKIGKLKEGQDVIVKFKNYPIQEFGMIKGKISTISRAPSKHDEFLLKVEFEIHKLKDQTRHMDPKPGLIADAEIITQDITLFERVSSHIVKGVNDI